MNNYDWSKDEWSIWMRKVRSDKLMFAQQDGKANAVKAIKRHIKNEDRKLNLK